MTVQHVWTEARWRRGEASELEAGNLNTTGAAEIAAEISLAVFTQAPRDLARTEQYQPREGQAARRERMVESLAICFPRYQDTNRAPPSSTR